MSLTLRAIKQLAIVSLIASALLFSGCATQKPAPETAVSASLKPGREVALDQFRLKLPLALALDNPGTTALTVESVDCSLAVDGERVGAYSSSEPRLAAAGGTLAIPLEFPVDLRSDPQAAAGGSASTAAWKAEARISLRNARGGLHVLAASAEGAFPIVRDPKFRITSIRIERDLLVTTNLDLALQIENPNAFPLRFSGFVYNFYGEGRAWVDGGSDEPAIVPAASSMTRVLRFTMNFADMDRRLLDLVANLKAVRYRLRGQAQIATGLDYLPTFVSRFDREGVCAVER